MGGREEAKAGGLSLTHGPFPSHRRISMEGLSHRSPPSPDTPLCSIVELFRLMVESGDLEGVQWMDELVGRRAGRVFREKEV